MSRHCLALSSPLPINVCLFFILIGLSRPLRTRDNWAKGKQGSGQIHKYGTNRADIQRDATIVFAGRIGAEFGLTVDVRFGQ